MPRVPTYDQFTTMPSDAAQPRFSAPDMPMVAGKEAEALGQGMMRGAQAIGEIQDKIALEADQTRVIDAANQAMNARLNLTYSKEEGFLNFKGKNALERPDGKPLDVEYSEKYQQQLQAIADGLGNDRQKFLFKQATTGMQREFAANINQHVASEYKEYQVGVYNGTITTATNKMALDWGNAASVAESRALIVKAVEARDKDLPEEARQANLVKALSPGHTAVVGSAIEAGNTLYAKEYLLQHAAEIAPEARLQLAKAVETGDFESRTQDFAQKFWTESGGDLTKALELARDSLSGKDEDRTVERLKVRATESKEALVSKAQATTEQLLGDAKGNVAKALAAARAQLDGDLEDAVVTRIKAIDGERVALRERAQKDAGDRAWRIYAETGSVEKIPATVLAAMDGRDLTQLRATARADTNAKLSGETVKTDPNVYYALSAMAAEKTSDFQTLDLRNFFDKLSPADRKHFIDLQGKTNKPDEASQVVTTEQQKSAMVKKLKLKDDDAGIFLDQANKALMAAQQEKGRNLTQEERQKVLDGLVVEGEIPGTFFGTNTVRRFEARERGMDIKNPKFSPADVSQARQSLVNQGVANPTQQQIDAVLKKVYGIK